MNYTLIFSGANVFYVNHTTSENTLLFLLKFENLKLEKYNFLFSKSQTIAARVRPFFIVDSDSEHLSMICSYPRYSIFSNFFHSCSLPLFFPLFAAKVKKPFFSLDA